MRNGRRKIIRQWRRPKESRFADDSFSRELRAQGADGAFMRMLYLNPPMETYKSRILDEPIRD